MEIPCDMKEMKNTVVHMNSGSSAWDSPIFKRRTIQRKKRIFKNKKLTFTNGYLRSNYHSMIIGASGSNAYDTLL